MYEALLLPHPLASNPTSLSVVVPMVPSDGMLAREILPDRFTDALENLAKP